MVRPYTLSLSTSNSTNAHYFFYFTAADTLKRCDFLTFHHYTSQIKDMKQRAVGMGSKDSNIYQKAHQHA